MRTAPCGPTGKEMQMAVDDMYVRFRGRYAQLLNGDIKVEDLDDEEVARGQLRAKDGSFRGGTPRVLPGELVTAMKREWLSRAQNRLQEALLEKGIGTLVSLAGSDRIDPAVRLRAATALIERNMGKVPDKLEVVAEDPVEAMFRNILNDPQGLADPSGAPPREPSAEELDLLS